MPDARRQRDDLPKDVRRVAGRPVQAGLRAPAREDGMNAGELGAIAMFAMMLVAAFAFLMAGRRLRG